MPSPHKLVIVDRDGTINIDSDDYIKSVEEWQPYPNALHAIARLNHAGWHVVVATNQSGLGRGLFDMATLNAMHEKMHRSLAAVGARVDAVFFCPHTPEDACACRKPASGLFEHIKERYGRSLEGVPNVGDSLRDLQRDGMIWKPLRDVPKNARMLLITRKDNTSPVLAAFKTIAAKHTKRRSKAG